MRILISYGANAAEHLGTSNRYIDRMSDETTPAQHDEGQADPKDHNAELKKFLQSKWFRIGFTVIIAAAAIYAFSQEITEQELEGAFTDSNLWWVLAAAIAGLLTWVGAAIPLMAFCPVKVSVKDATLIQIASTFVDVAAPAGMGSVAVHLRYMVKRGVKGASATAALLLIEGSQVAGSVLLLIVSLIFTRLNPHVQFPLGTILIVIAAIVVCIVVIAFLPKFRKQVVAKAKEWWEGMRPTLVWAWRHPKAQWTAIGGVVLQSLASSFALLFCLLALGHPISLALAVSVYIIASTVGSMVPTPGGIGSAEAAYTAALVLVGVPAGVALSAVILFRVVTFYGQVPIGWVGWQRLNRIELI